MESVTMEHVRLYKGEALIQVYMHGDNLAHIVEHPAGLCINKQKAVKSTSSPKYCPFYYVVFKFMDCC